MVVTFLRGRQKVSFQLFKASLNFLTPALQSKVLFVVKRKINQDIQKRINSVLESSENVEKRWNKLVQILQNPQFEELMLFGYNLNEILYKMKSLLKEENPEKMIDNIFSKKVPESLKTIVIEKHARDNRKPEKNLETFFEDLLKLRESLAKNEVSSLKRPLTNLFQFYGKVNFSGSSEKLLTGYDVSRSIEQTYYKPDVIKYLQNLSPEIAKVLLEIVEEEQKKRLKKQKKD